MATLGLLAMMLPVSTVVAAPPGISLEQCRNGSAASPNDCEALGSGTGWVSGNVGASQGHLLEGYSIPYRAVMTNLPLGTTIEMVLGYDIARRATPRLPNALQLAVAARRSVIRRDHRPAA
jgi:hypothetical protein